jgi:hypothetical protein
MPITVAIELTAEDLALLRRIHSRSAQLAHSPKRHQVGGYPGARASAAEKADQRTFERLKLLNIVIHSSTGQCWLSDDAKKIIG